MSAAVKSIVISSGGGCARVPRARHTTQTTKENTLKIIIINTLTTMLMYLPDRNTSRNCTTCGWRSSEWLTISLSM